MVLHILNPVSAYHHVGGAVISENPPVVSGAVNVVDVIVLNPDIVVLGCDVNGAGIHEKAIRSRCKIRRRLKQLVSGDQPADAMILVSSIVQSRIDASITEVGDLIVLNEKIRSCTENRIYIVSAKPGVFH